MSDFNITGPSLILAGVLVGYILGYFFSNKKVFQMILSKEDIENAVETVNEMNKIEQEGGDPSEVQPIKVSAESLSSSNSEEIKYSNTEEDVNMDKEDNNGDYHFYKIHLPVISVGKNPEDVYYGLLKKFKRLKNNNIGNNGFIVENEAYVERISRSQADRYISV